MTYCPYVRTVLDVHLFSYKVQHLYEHLSNNSSHCPLTAKEHRHTYNRMVEKIRYRIIE